MDNLIANKPWLTRRDFLKLACAGHAALALPFMPRTAKAGWEEVPAILKRIRPPVFPKRDFDISRYGASGEGTADCTKAIQQAIKACHEAGG